MNCKSCKYAVIDIDCICEIHILNTGIKFIIPQDKVELDCPCHSEIFHEETRYGFQNLNKRLSYDVCECCQRQVENIDNLKIISNKVEKKIIKKRVCTICSS